MNTKRSLLIVFAVIVALLIFTTGMSLAKRVADTPSAFPHAALGTGLTYQGILEDNGAPADGAYDFYFELYDAETDGTLVMTTTAESLAVADGLFTAMLDFGSGAFNGDERWLAISVRPWDDTGAYTPLTPRQPLTAAPYAQYAVEAGGVAWENVSQNPIPGSCASGEIMAWNETLAAWECVANTGTAYDAGFGLELDGTTFNVLSTTIQTRVTGTCTPGSMVTTINTDGSVVCEVDDDTTYAAGTGLELDGTTFNVLSTTVQTRVTGTCTPGSMVTGINTDGSVVCEADDDTTYTAGTGLELDGTTFNVMTDTLQARISGKCKVGSTIQTINADGTVECEPHDTLPEFTQTAIDTTDRTGADTALVIGTDGLPIIAYRYVGVSPNYVNHLAVAHCNDVACTSAITTKIDTTGRIELPSIAIGSDGLPVIAYYRVDGAYDLKVAHCDDIACTSATLNSPDTTNNVGGYPSIAIGTDGLPIISYSDISNGTLKAAHCNDVACSSASTTVVDQVLGTWTSIAIGVDGYPIISYKNFDADDLKVAHCENATCTSVTSTTLATAGNVGDYTEITIGNDGLPIIVFKGGTNYSSSRLSVAHCDDITCATATITDLWSNHDYVAGSIAIGSDGLPVLSFRSNDTDRLMVAHCYDVACTTSSWVIVDDPANEVGGSNSIKIGTDGMPIISYFDNTAGDLKVTHCSNVFCVPYWRR